MQQIPPTPPPQPQTSAPPRAPTIMEQAVAARRTFKKGQVEEAEKVYENTCWVARCPTCTGIAIVFRDGFNPNGSEISSADWTALYRPDPATPWTLTELLCGECMNRNQRNAVRAKYDYNRGTFMVVGRQVRFLEQLDIPSGRFVRELRQEADAKKHKQRELMQLAQIQGVTHASV